MVSIFSSNIRATAPKICHSVRYKLCSSRDWVRCRTREAYLKQIRPGLYYYYRYFYIFRAVPYNLRIYLLARSASNHETAVEIKINITGSANYTLEDIRSNNNITNMTGMATNMSKQ